jgi:histone-lysine N-methyltransferase SETMAR
VQKKCKIKAPTGKVILTVFWNSEGAVLTDFLGKGATVNSELYTETLKKKNIKKKCIMRKEAETNDALLQHDNARPHTSIATTDATVHLVFTLLPHPAHSPDLTSSDFHLFPKWMDELRGQNFSFDDVKAALHKWFWEGEKTFLRMEFKNLLKAGKGVSKLDKIMWKKQLCTVVNKGYTYIYLFT